MKITTEEDLIEALKKSLRVEVSKETPYWSYGDKPEDDVRVKIYYGEILITEDYS